MKKATQEKNLLIVLIILLIIPLFGNLGYLPIRLWDESRVAINAYEMFAKGQWIVSTYDWQPDLWNTKPPLLLWLQVFFMKILGVNEWAVRLPSALAALMTCLILYFFLKNYLNKTIPGLMAALILVTAQGYVSIHGTRTGDYDSLLILFTTISGLAFFTYIENKKNKYLYLFFLSTALAVLTKSITGLLFAPALFLYSLANKQFIPLLKNKHFYLGGLVMILFIASYYLLREHYNPGYLRAVYENELGGRYLTTIENHNHGFLFYFNMIFAPRFIDWILFFFAGIFLGLKSNDIKTRKITLFSVIMTTTFLLIISSAKTKLIWYDLPMYPFMSIIASIGLYSLYQFLNAKFQKKQNILPVVIISVLMIIPYIRILNSSLFSKEKGDMGNPNYHDMSYYLREATEGKHDLNGMICLFDEYVPQNQFYIYALNHRSVDIRYEWGVICQSGRQYIVQSDQLKSYIENTCQFEIINTYNSVTVYRIL